MRQDGYRSSTGGREYRGGNYSSWLEQKKNRLEGEEKAESERQKTLQRELEWIRMSPGGRHAKAKARINSYESLLSQDIEKKVKGA
jgi:sulfate-transporting ATPase